MNYKQFTEAEISKIYNNYVKKSPAYFLKYAKLPIELNDKTWKWENKDFSRIPCILDFREWINRYGLGHFENVLSTCKDDPELEYISYDKIRFIPYENKKNDLHTLNLDEKNFDFIIFSQTLEHLYNPFIAVENLYAHLEEGGYLFTSVPTLNIPHLVPAHFWGLTPMGLCVLMKSIGFDIIEIGYWGNADYIRILFETHSWPDYRALSTNGIIPNEAWNNVQTWILARK
jgi:hypothetical protein